MSSGPRNRQNGTISGPRNRQYDQENLYDFSIWFINLTFCMISSKLYMVTNRPIFLKTYIFNSKSQISIEYVYNMNVGNFHVNNVFIANFVDWDMALNKTF